jgi:hypothetical protein
LVAGIARAIERYRVRVEIEQDDAATVSRLMPMAELATGGDEDQFARQVA